MRAGDALTFVDAGSYWLPVTEVKCCKRPLPILTHRSYIEVWFLFLVLAPLVLAVDVYTFGPLPYSHSDLHYNWL